MAIKIALTLVLIFAVFGLSSCSAQENKIDKPVWRVGDSWKVKCPLMTARPGSDSRKYGEYTVSVEVLNNAKFREDDCYILQIKAMDDLPGRIKSEPSNPLKVFAYYRVNDLKLMRIEQFSGSDEDTKPRNSINASSDHPLFSFSGDGTWIPLQLPTFPVIQGRSVVLSHTECKDKDTLSRANKGENVEVSRSTVEEARTVRADEGQIAAPGAMRITFADRPNYSVSGEEEHVRIEQVWVPGKPWWSSARVYRSPKDVWEYIASW